MRDCMFLNVCWGLTALFLMAGCTTSDVPPPPDNHPANAETNAISPPNPSSTLHIENPVKSPEKKPVMQHDMAPSHDNQHESGRTQ